MTVDGFQVFTPYVQGKHYRAYMLLDKKDGARLHSAKVRDRVGWKETVTDQNSGQRYLVKSASCGAGCHCAAEIVTELDETVVQ